MVEGDGRPGHPQQGRPHPLLGALETDRLPLRRPSTAVTVQIFDEGEQVKTHAALEQGKRTDGSDYPPEKIASQMRTPIQCCGQASH
jgi:hypothetical protein